MKYFYKCKNKGIRLNKYTTIVQNPWFYVLPTISLFAEGEDGTFGKICHVQIEWLYWGVGLSFYKL
jgi:hypothetical protein